MCFGFRRNAVSDEAGVMSTGRLFRSFRPAKANDRSPAVTRRDRRTVSWLEVGDRSRLWDEMSATRLNRSDRYRLAIMPMTYWPETGPENWYQNLVPVSDQYVMGITEAQYHEELDRQWPPVHTKNLIFESFCIAYMRTQWENLSTPWWQGLREDLDQEYAGLTILWLFRFCSTHIFWRKIICCPVIGDVTTVTALRYVHAAMQWSWLLFLAAILTLSTKSSTFLSLREFHTVPQFVTAGRKQFEERATASGDA